VIFVGMLIMCMFVLPPILGKEVHYQLGKNLIFAFPLYCELLINFYYILIIKMYLIHSILIDKSVPLQEKK
jgi:hypothetical protein